MIKYYNKKERLNCVKRAYNWIGGLNYQYKGSNLVLKLQENQHKIARNDNINNNDNN